MVGEEGGCSSSLTLSTVQWQQAFLPLEAGRQGSSSLGLRLPSAMKESGVGDHAERGSQLGCCPLYCLAEYLAYQNSAISSRSP